MRINKFIAASSNLSRRGADEAIISGRISVNGKPPEQGQDITARDIVKLDGHILEHTSETVTIMLNKPVGYVVSRDGQGSKTVYDLLAAEYQRLNPVGRLDKDSSGLLLLTSDGNLANDLTHPSKQKLKIYEVALDKALEPLHRQMISDYGIQLGDGPSKLQLDRVQEGDDTKWRITMHEGRNRQIRRTFESLGYAVKALHRISFGDYDLLDLQTGMVRTIREIL